MHISIEGMDGVGKTTACALLAEKFDMEFIEKPLKYLFSEDADEGRYIEIRDYVNKQDDRIFTSWFYGLGNIYLYHKFGDRSIVTDRHLLSNYAWSGDSVSEIVFDTLLKAIGTPDHTFILYAKPEKISARIRSRNIADSDLRKIGSSEEKYEKMRYFAKRSKMSYSEIDSTDLTAEGVHQRMIEELKSRGLI